MFQADTVCSVPCLTEKEMVRESISKMKKQKAAGPLCVVSEMVKTAGEREVGMTTVLVNQIIGRVIPPEWELSVIVNCFKGKDNS